jgi:hypothetical protein
MTMLFRLFSYVCFMCNQARSCMFAYTLLFPLPAECRTAGSNDGIKSAATKQHSASLSSETIIGHYPRPCLNRTDNRGWGQEAASPVNRPTLSEAEEMCSFNVCGNLKNRFFSEADKPQTRFSAGMYSKCSKYSKYIRMSLGLRLNFLKPNILTC